MRAPVLFPVSVLFTIWLHLISTCSMGHDPRDILDDGSIHLLGNVFGPTPEMPCKHLMVCGTSTKMQGLWPLQAGTPCAGVTHREGNSFVLLSELHLVDALTGCPSWEAAHDHGVRSHDPSQQSTYPWTLCSVAHVCAGCLLRDHNQREYVTVVAPLALRPYFGYSPCLHLRRPPAQP